MAWWDDGEGNMVGDIVADHLTDITKQIKAAQPGIDIETFLQGLVMALADNPAIYTDGPSPVATITMEIDDNDEEITVRAAGKPTAAVVQHFRDGIQGTAAIFEETFERKPKLSELFANLIFVLPGGSRYFTLGDEALIMDLRAE